MPNLAISPMPLRLKNGKVAGYLRSHRFRKEVFGHLHMNMAPPGWGIDAEIFDKLPRYGVTVIQVLDKDDKKLYVTSWATFNLNCLPIERKGQGLQKVLALPLWLITHD